MGDFHFLRPEWFWGFAVFLLLPFIVGKSGRGGLWQKLCDITLLRFQLVNGKGKKLFLPFFLITVSWILALISLAGPAWKKLPQAAVKKGADTVYVADISVLMTPSDIKPSRMERARFKIHDFLQKTKDGQNALILYAEDPFVAVPLTTDKRIIGNLLPTIKAGMMGNKLPDPAAAINKAADLLTQAKSSDGRIVVLSGYLPDDAMPGILIAAEKIRQAGYSLSFLGIATTRGAPLQLEDGSFLTDRGKPVLTGLSRSNMKKAALAGNGTYHEVTLDEKDVDAILKEDDPSGVSSFFNGQEQAKADTWKDFGAVLCIFILPFALFGYRKGWLGVWFFLAFFPSVARAWTISDLWTRADRKEAMAISAGEKPHDPDVFKDAAWRGAAAYKAGDYAAAASALAEKEDAESFYNKGNALAFAGQYQQALEAYKKALEKEPRHEDAAFNKKYLEEQLKKNKQQNQQQQNQQRQQNEKNKQDKEQQAQAHQNQQQKQQAQPEQKSSSERETEKDPEKQEQMQWLSVIKDDPSGLLRERIRRRNLAKRGRR